MPRTIDPAVTAFGLGDQPVFDLGNEVILRPFAPSDAPIVRAAFADLDIIRWHHFRIDADADADAIAWIERSHQMWAAASKVDWLIEEGGEGRGRVGLHVDESKGVAEIAYWLLADGRGRGLASRSAVAVTAWAHDIGIHRILLQHSTRNGASCAVAQRVGFRVEGTARQLDLHDDGWHDMHQHAHVAGDALS